MALNFPASPVNGQIYFDPTSGNRYVYDAATTKWSYTANNTPTGSVYLSNTAPPGAVAGDLWWNSDLGTMFIFYSDGDSTQWVESSPSGGVSDVAASFQTINVAFDVANAAFNSANNVAPQVAPSYNTANAAYTQANAAYTNSNTAFNVANAAFNSANNVAPQVAPSYNTANAAYVVANSAYNFANGVATNAAAGFALANGVAINAAAAFAAANNVAPQVTPAFNTANAAYTVANAAFGAANAEFTFSNTIYAAVNSAFGVINAAYTSSNADYVVSNAAFGVANSALAAANQAGVVANNANTFAISAFVRKSGDTITGDLVVQGNVTISGNTTYANTQTLLIGDNILTLNADLPAAVAPSEDAGIEIRRGSSANVLLLWNEGSDRWTFTNDGTNYRLIASNTDVESANNYAGAMANSGNVFAGLVYTAVNSAFAVINAAYTSSNADYVVSNAAFSVANGAFGFANGVATNTTAAFARANAALANTSGVSFNGNLFFPSGNVGIGTTASSVPLTVSRAAQGTITYFNGPTSHMVYQDFGGAGGASYLWHNNSDLYFGTYTANNLYIGTNSSARITVTNSGNVGIGQTSAPERLAVFRDTDNSAEFGRAHVGFVGFADYAGFSHVDMNSQTTYSLLQQSTGQTYINSASGTPIYFRHNNIDQMILSGGNLGIGTTAPGTAIDVLRTTNDVTIRAKTSGAGAWFYADSGNAGYSGLVLLGNGTERWMIGNFGTNNLTFKEGRTGSERMTIVPSSGNVGIGNTAPNLKLEVAGNMSVDAFVENSANIATSYTITAGRNAMTAGPVTLNTGVVVEVPAGSTWTIV